MKNAITSITSRFVLLSLCLVATITAFAQDASTTSQTNTTESHSTSTAAVPNDAQSWLSNPIVWVVGGVVLLLIIVGLMSSRGNKSKSTVTRTSTTEVKVD